MKSNTLDRQVDGTHYKDMELQPWTIIKANKLDYWEGAALKYLLRWKEKDGITDLDKIIHYVEHIKQLALEGHYGDEFMSLDEKLKKLKEGWGNTYPLFDIHKEHKYANLLNNAFEMSSKASNKPVATRSINKRTKPSPIRKKALK